MPNKNVIIQQNLVPKDAPRCGEANSAIRFELSQTFNKLELQKFDFLSNKSRYESKFFSRPILTNF